MYYLYVIKSLVKNWHYIGTTADIENRVAEHNAGEVRSTKACRPLVLVHEESFSDKQSARKREIFLKNNARARKDLFGRIMASSSNG